MADRVWSINDPRRHVHAERADDGTGREVIIVRACMVHTGYGTFKRASSQAMDAAARRLNPRARVDRSGDRGHGLVSEWTSPYACEGHTLGSRSRRYVVGAS